MGTLPDTVGSLNAIRLDDVDVLAPTMLEYVAIRMVMSSPHVELCGVGLARRYPAADRPNIICGLAGSLTDALRPGDVVIPVEVGKDDGDIVPCDPELVELLRRGAQRAGYTPRAGRLLTASSIVTGVARTHWATRGFDVADMETGHLAGAGRRTATIRVILDSPSRPISNDWVNASRTLTRPQFWREASWLAWAAPRYAWRAAIVVRSALFAPAQ